MSVKKRISSLGKLYSSCEELADEFLDETDVDGYFYHNIFDNSQSQHRIVRVSKGSHKNSFAFNLFQFWNLKTQQRYILQEEVIISTRELSSLVDSLSEFLKNFDEASKFYRIGYRNTKFQLDLRKDNLFSQYDKGIIEHTNRPNRLSVRYENNNFSFFSIKTFELRVNQFLLVKIVKSVNCNNYRRALSIQETMLCCKHVWNNWKQLWCVAHSTVIVGMTIAL